MNRTGAEATVTAGTWMDRRTVAKRRAVKGYRHPALDQRIRHARTRDEAALLGAARRAGVAVPVVYDVDRGKATITMEAVPGRSLREALATDDAATALERLRALGAATAKLHEAGITHGDLTTSNVLVPDASAAGDLVLIDFGLGQATQEAEPRGVDLHLVEEALEATDARAHALFAAFLQGYQWSGREDVLRRLEEIRQRGRNR